MRPATKIDVSYNAIFYSAFKALVVFELLMESPKTFKQIYEALSKISYIKSNISKDTLRVYINSFRQAGCNVERILTKGNHREYAFFIPDNPFRPCISEKQTDCFFDIYDILMYNLPFKDFLQTELLVQKLDEELKSPYFHEVFEVHSILKEHNWALITELEECCQAKSLITVLYKSPNSGKKEIKIHTNKMFFQSYKLYLKGFGLEYKEETIFPVERILEIRDVTDGRDIKIPENSFDIIFELYDSSIPLLENEKTLEEANGIKRVSHRTTNKILSIQRFLQLSNKCKLLEPKNFVNDFVDILKSAKEAYSYGQ